ncbi:MAG TPA: Nramp family divalent metal transporter [Phycisphaerae bacterium]|nr:Nramp family divalent metal transporter [Phycisphaerae bacterium]
MARKRTQPSLPEVHNSVVIRRSSSFLRRLLTFTGPAFMVSVGYMDPGNWATDLSAGARCGYRLIWVILVSNLMAIVLQTLAARLGLVTRRDLAQACHDHYPPAISFVLWVLCEIAVAACDLAEVLGSAIGLYLLFGIPLLWGVVITAFDVLILLALQSYGIRKMEAVVLTLVATIGVCFTVEMFLSRPPMGALVAGFIPHSLSRGELYLAIGILGATVMPHNLYLHSALVQSRAVEPSKNGLTEAAGFNLFDSVVALNAAFLVNAAILVLAAATFHKAGQHDVASLRDAHALLEPLLGSVLAPIMFAIGLLAAGQSSTITGTMAGQVVMEGFVSWRLRPWLRRLITRLIAIVPAVIVILWRGDRGADDLLILSQVILSLQLSFAVVPLVHFTSDRRKMGVFATPWWGRILAWLATGLVLGLNAALVCETISDGLAAGTWVVRYLLLPVTIVLVPLLAWMIAEPIWRRWREQLRGPVPTPVIPPPQTTLASQYHRVALALEAGPQDAGVLAGVIPLIRAAGAEVVLIHVVESAVARFLGESVDDTEARQDADYLERVADRLRVAGLICITRLGAGDPAEEIARLAEQEHSDLIVTGAHGHRLLGDLFHGSTVNDLRHLTDIPVLTIRGMVHPTPAGQAAGTF